MFIYVSTGIAERIPFILFFHSLHVCVCVAVYLYQVLAITMCHLFLHLNEICTSAGCLFFVMCTAISRIQTRTSCKSSCTNAKFYEKTFYFSLFFSFSVWFSCIRVLCNGYFNFIAMFVRASEVKFIVE